jgi:hypothetical protein
MEKTIIFVVLDYTTKIVSFSSEAGSYKCSERKKIYFFDHVITILSNHNHKKSKFLLYPMTQTKNLLNQLIIF